MTSTLETFNFPWMIPVSDFYDEEYGQEDYSDAKSAAFETARELGLDKAIYQARQAFSNEPESYVLDGGSFDDFDASNLGHAGAHFLIQLSCPRERFVKLMMDEMGEEIDPMDYLVGGRQAEMEV